MLVNGLSKDKCTGCMSCYNKCPNGSIKIVFDDEGFAFPEINYTTCIHCNKCIKTCPAMQDVQGHKIRDLVYAVISKDENTLMQSTSGGAFTEICKGFCSDNDKISIFGCLMDRYFKVRHSCIDSLDDIGLFARSKYVQSNVGYIYRDVEKKLNQGNKVVFSGTPCQVAALYLYLNKEYKNLLTIDFVCHGVPSQKIFTCYLESLNRHYKDKVNKFRFRNKIIMDDHWDFIGTQVQFESGKLINIPRKKEWFMNVYFSGRLTRDCCGSCKYASIERVADITLGDFHGISEHDPNWDANNTSGCSLVITNTEKGNEIFERIKENIKYIEVKSEIAIHSNIYLRHSVPQPMDSHLFITKALEGDFICEAKKLFPELYLHRRIIRKIRNIISPV